MAQQRRVNAEGSKAQVIKFSAVREELAFRNVQNEHLAILTHYLQAPPEIRKKHFELAPDLGLNDLAELTVKWDIPFPPNVAPSFTFIDLFAGIGGMRAAFQSANGQCVFSSEWDRKAQTTYFENFGEIPFGDITKIKTSDVPKHDVLVAGFPCQAFSIAGARAGFEDTRGTLFFDVARLISAKRPKAFLLENVKGLASHDRGRTLATILEVLRHDLGYHVPEPQILNAKHFGVPQNRERIFIVGFSDEQAYKKFKYPLAKDVNKTVSDILEQDEVSVKYYMSTQYLRTLVEHRRRHESKGNGFGFEIIPIDGIANAIVVGGMGRERNLVIDKRLTTFKPITKIKGSVNRRGIRRMTPREWARLQGFPDKFVIPVSDAQAYKQFGNSVAVPVVRAVGKNLLNALEL